MPAMFQSITFKVLGVGVLALLMLIPLAEVQGLIGERNRMREQAVSAIAQRWGAVQVLGGPVLAVPKRTRIETNNGWIVQQSTEIVSPTGSISAARWRLKSAATECTPRPCIQLN